MSLLLAVSLHSFILSSVHLQDQGRGLESFLYLGDLDFLFLLPEKIYHFVRDRDD